jgi:hypothetical protein
MGTVHSGMVPTLEINGMVKCCVTHVGIGQEAGQESGNGRDIEESSSRTNPIRDCLGPYFVRVVESVGYCYSRLPAGRMVSW